MPCGHLLLTEIQAKYTETSAKTGYNIGESHLRSSQPYYLVYTAESLFLNIAEDFIENSKTKAASRAGK